MDDEDDDGAPRPMVMSRGDGDAAYLRLPTDEDLDRALAEWKAHALPAGHGDGDGATRMERTTSGPPVVVAPLPGPDRRRLIQAASELLTSQKARKPSKQRVYRQRLRAAGRCQRCGGEIEPGYKTCATHRRDQRRRTSVIRHRKTVKTAGVARGIFVRISEPASQRLVSTSTSRSHVRRPAQECLLCRRVKGRCRRHDGPNRSTSFRGAAPSCSYCKRPKGHAPTCRRAR